MKNNHQDEVKIDKETVAILFILIFIAAVMVLGVISLGNIAADVWNAIL